MAKKRRSKARRPKAHYTPLESHQQKGKTFVPPFLQLPRLQTQSWINDRLPEMLWAALLIDHFGRGQGLDAIRRVAKYGYRLREFDKPLDVTLSHIASWPVDWRREVLGILTTGAEPKRALRPLLLFSDVPARDDWVEAIGVASLPEKDWPALARAVLKVLHHQSEEATDCRWARVVFQITLGRFHFHVTQSEQAEELLFYPDRGDLRSVRPLVRSTELNLRAIYDESRVWPEKFWAQCLADTGCKPLPPASDNLSESEVTAEAVEALYNAVSDWAERTRVTSAVDARHETIVGATLFSLGILHEISDLGAGRAILGRLGLRTLLEVELTLAHLLAEDDAELWGSHRAFGAGQAKLQFMHLDRLQSKPFFVDAATLESLANEDQWQEFLPVEVGHWAGLNLRDISVKTTLKDEYDKIYPWTSTYAHGHWGAIRDSVYAVCVNPLHRLHRVPLPQPRILEPVLKEAADIVARILTLAQTGYPNVPIVAAASEEARDDESQIRGC